ncbi:MAG TPA: hypothetical protein VGP68_00245 [Gemmataceae bacterium]|jgi:hypothetical protein|nr:hypothetical protein [Gemmataceae bacterium]
MSAQRMGWTGWFVVLACAVTCLGMSAAADPPSARTLIEQAIAAQGGMKALETIGATVVSTKGKWNEFGEATFKAETSTQSANKYRQVLSVETEGNRIPYIAVLNGDQAWGRDDLEVKEITGAELIDIRLQRYVDHVASLVPLLREEGFSLSIDARQTVNNAPADVVLVSKKDKPDVRLYFDSQSHLLAKIDHRRIDIKLDKEARFEDYLQDYRIVDLKGADRKILAAAKIGSDALSLNEFLGKQTLGPKEQKLVQVQIKALGDEKFAVREEAKNSLIKMGPRIAALLEEATHSSDPEISSRARECLPLLGKGPSPELLGAAIRTMIYEHNAESVDVLLAYLPCAGDDVIAKETRSALAALAATDSKAKERLTALSKAEDPVAKKAAFSALNPKQGDIGFRVYPANVKQAMKGVNLKNGKQTAEWETTEIKFYHSLPSSLFGKP